MNITIEGRVDWYAIAKGFGVIRGPENEEYFLHSSQVPSDMRPLPGLAVRFKSRKRRGRDGLEAYDVEFLAPSSAIPRPIPKSSAMPDSENEAMRRAAQFALQKKRERESGLGQDADVFQPGRTVRDGRYGLGTVISSMGNAVTVDFAGKAIDVDRSRLVLEDVQVSRAVTQTKIVAKPKARLVDTSELEQWLMRVRDESRDEMIREGLDPGRLYQAIEGTQPKLPAQPMADLDPMVADAFRRAEKVGTFYSHQLESRRQLRAGKNVILATATASGKTAAFNPTILERLLQNPQSRALYLFPLVALAMDQVGRLNRLNEELPEANRLEIAVFNNQADKEQKQRALRAANRIVVTTPESLHYILLPKPYPNWKAFFRELSFIVLDEAHLYKGVFGANMSGIMRRVLARCARERGPGKPLPQVIVASATLSDPLRLAEDLTSLPKEEFGPPIIESGARTWRRHCLATIGDVSDLCSELLDVRTTDGTSGQLRPVSIIVFLRSVAQVKRLSGGLRDHLKSNHSWVDGMVEEYYGDKSDKGDVFTRLREGRVRCVFTTNALMAGIDIGNLDVAIVKGFPGLVMDARQMFGRAGRGGVGVSIFLGDLADPFDAFYLEKPELLFSRPLIEDVVCNPDNPFLLAAHLHCAAQAVETQYSQEGPLSVANLDRFFGPVGRDVVSDLVRQGDLTHSVGNIKYVCDADHLPHGRPPLDNIRAFSVEEYQLIDGSGMVLERKQRNVAFRDAHPEAIVIKDGKYYRVVEFDHSQRSILCKELNDRSMKTRATEVTELKVVEELERAADSNVTERVRGRVKVETGVTSYVEIRITRTKRCRRKSCRTTVRDLTALRCPKCGSPLHLRDEETRLEKKQVPAPKLSTVLPTLAAWLEIDSGVEQRYNREFRALWNPGATNFDDLKFGPSYEVAIESVLRALLKIFPDRVRCDRDDVHGTTDVSPVAGQPARLYVYDNFREGLGLADRLFDVPSEFLRAAAQLIDDCTCVDDEGCPVCIQHTHFRNEIRQPSKIAAQYLLRLLLAQDVGDALDSAREMAEAAGQIPGYRL